MPGCHPPLQLSHSLLAPPAEAFAAWLDAERIAAWFPVQAGRIEVDPRIGCGFVVCFELDGVAVELRARWTAIDPPHRLAFDLTIKLPAGETQSQVTVDVAPDGNGSTVTLCHTGLPSEYAPQVGRVWRGALDRMIAACPAWMDSFFDRLDRGPRFRSSFGGLWPDLSDAPHRLAGRRALGLPDIDAERMQHWMEHGYVVLEKAVPVATIDAFLGEVARDWREGNPRLSIEVNDGGTIFPRMSPKYEGWPTKVLDYHSVSPHARDIQFAPAIRSFLELLFERPAMAFQSLLFRYGTEQEMHQDTAYVPVDSPMQFVGCWVALEDIQPGSGELQYFGGSHRIPEFVWFGRGRACPPGFGDQAPFLAWVREQSERSGCPLLRFHPKKGDVLLWHADLVHGGSPRKDRERTRWSLVTHYCPVDVSPEWMTRLPNSGRLEHAPGCYYSFVTRR